MKNSYAPYSAPLPSYGTSLVDRINIYLHFRRYFRIISERWVLLTIFALTGCAIGVWRAYSKPDQFQSTSRLYSTPRIVPLSQSGPTVQEEQGSTEALVAVMNSEPVLQRVMIKLQESNGRNGRLTRPSTKAESKGATFLLSVTATNFEDARQFAVAWVHEFVEFHKSMRKQKIDAGSVQITQQLISFGQKLESAQQELEEFQKVNNIASLADAGLAAQKRLEFYQEDYERLKTDLRFYQTAKPEELASGGVKTSGATQRPRNRSGGASRGAAVESDSDDTDLADQFSADSQYRPLTKKMSQIEKELEERGKTLKEKHPYILSLRRQLGELEAERRTDLELVEKARLAQIKALETRIGRYPPLIEELKTEVFDLGSKRQELERLQKNVQDINSTLDDLHRQQLAVSRIGADEDEFTILEEGSGDPRKVGPDRPKIIAAGAGIGLAAAAALVFLLHRLDDRLESPEDIEAKLEEPILGQIPEVDKRRYTEGYLLLTRMKAHTMFAEALRGVRSALLLSPEGANKRMLAVTSAVPGDGKTTFTTNFAITLANSGAKTLLVDGDLRRGNIHSYFEQPAEGGLSEVLLGKLPMRQAVRETGIKNLFLMRAGDRPSNPSELLIGPATKELIRDLRAEFDYVIFDCPPLTAIDDTFSIAAYLDGILFVVRAGSTSIRFAKMGINTIHQRGAPFIGLIVNGVPIDNPYYYYTTYYYASYYHRPLAPDDNIYPDSPQRRLGNRPAAVTVEDDGAGLNLRERRDAAGGGRGNDNPGKPGVDV
jgi:polysaccharide biosynthesis transport protein